ncbi:MAG: diphthine synthase [Halobacteriaceae archaeon]
MLTFVGLGLYDERCVTLRGRDAVRDADRVFLEWYTSRLVDATPGDLETFHDVDVAVLGRSGVEEDPGAILAAAESGDAAFATAGDPLVATTHVDLRLRAHERGVDTRVVHGPSAAVAAAGLTGLQQYRFGKAVTLPFPYGGGDDVPPSVVDTIVDNRERGLHTLVFLDIKADEPAAAAGTGGTGGDGTAGGGEERFMDAATAADLLAGAAPADWLAVAVARAGAPEPVVAADRLSGLAERAFGPPLHLLVIPGDLHHMERESLAALAGASEDVLPAED